MFWLGVLVGVVVTVALAPVLIWFFALGDKPGL